MKYSGYILKAEAVVGKGVESQLVSMVGHLGRGAGAHPQVGEGLGAGGRREAS